MYGDGGHRKNAHQSSAIVISQLVRSEGGTQGEVGVILPKKQRKEKVNYFL